MRKPKVIDFAPGARAHVWSDDGERGAFLLAGGWDAADLTPKQCRKLAAWLLRAADWMDAGASEIARGEHRKATP